MKEMTYITIKGSIAVKFGDKPHVYLTDFNPEGGYPVLTFTSPEAVADWIRNKMKNV